MADITTGRRVILAASAMIVTAQLLAIANDVVLRQSDPPDVILLPVLIVLSVLVLRRVRWARWTVAVLVAAGGLLELASVGLLIATALAPGFWSTVDASVPALAGLHDAVVAFAAAPAFPLLTGSVLVGAVLELTAAWMLMFATSVRSYFASDTAAPRA